MKERTFQDATAAVLQSVPLGMLSNMLKILGEIILDESGFRLRSLNLILFFREYDNAGREKGWNVISTQALLVDVLDCIPAVLSLRNAEHWLFTLSEPLT